MITSFSYSSHASFSLSNLVEKGGRKVMLTKGDHSVLLAANTRICAKKGGK